MKNSKIVIWDLFGGGLNSVYNTLKENDMLNDYEIYTFDVTEPKHNNQIQMDLSNPQCVAQLTIYPQPDIILASPLCQSFSTVMNMKNGTAGWELINDHYEIRTKESFETNKSGFVRQCKYDDIKARAQLGKRCLENTIRIIEHFKPKYWYIENPKNSLMWKVMEKNYFTFYKDKIKNCTNYNNYGFIIKKPTCFLSNINLSLSNENKTNYTYYYDENNIRYINVFDDEHNLVLNCKASFFRSGMLNKLNGLVSKKNGSETAGSSAIPHKLIKHILERMK